MSERTAEHDACAAISADGVKRLVQPAEMAAEIDGVHFEVRWICLPLLAAAHHRRLGELFRCLCHVALLDIECGLIRRYPQGDCPCACAHGGPVTFASPWPPGTHVVGAI